MEQRGNKTIMCSVLFLDIVAYSKKSVSAQIAQKELFNAMLANAICNAPVNDRVILDTGDGAAVTFLGDVEDALKAALAFRESLLGEGASMDPPLQVCMGINLGPVRLVKDINGQPNIVGDGINVAQRIMGFAKPGQILVSRSYFDAASRLSHEYAGMFHNEGSRTDKHVREHEIYAVGQPSDATAAQNQAGNTLGIAVKQGSVPVTERWLQIAIATFQNASNQQRALYAGIIASALALLIVVAVKIVHRPEAPAPQLAAETQTTPVAVPVAPDAASAPPAAEEIVVPPKAAKKPKAAQPAEIPADQEKDHKQQESATQDHAAKKTTETTPDAMASVSIAIAPWGEIYLDGKKQGVSPPLFILHVAPGEHAIEIRNTAFPPYTQSIQVKAGEKIKIKHKFAN
jgi:class 3 adenylate cyclase